MALSVSSPAFQQNGPIPVKYTCDGENISPPLELGEPPEGATSLALIVDDPDAPGGVFTHWVMFNIPASTRKLEEAIPGLDHLPNGALQGSNDAGETGYFGPCPPSGRHRYRFTLHALAQPVDLKAGASKERLLAAMHGRILDQGQLVGTYQR